MTTAIDPAGTRASTAWIMLLTAASTLTTLALACATPFPALAALAALHMRRRDGVALGGAAWVASQAVGFCVLDYPRDAGTLAWGAAIGTAAVAGAFAAHAAVRPATGRAAALALAYVAAFAAFKLVILLWSLVLGEVGPAVSLPIMARQFVRNAAILAGLVVLYHGVRALGLPAPRGRARVAA